MISVLLIKRYQQKISVEVEYNFHHPKGNQ